MSRLTAKNESICDYCEYERNNGCIKKDPAKCVFNITWNKLNHYEDLEEAGRLIELPCKLGDTVYYVVPCTDSQYHIKEMVVKEVGTFGAIRWVKGKDPELWNVYLKGNYEYAYRHFYDFGRTVFLTKAEAEAKLEELKGGESDGNS